MRRSSLLAGVVAVVLMFAAGGARAYTAKPIYLKAYGAGSFINTTFTFYKGPDGLTTEIGADTLGGQNFSQTVSEYYDSYDSCWATDGTLGELYYLYEALGVTTYVNGGQIYAYANDGTDCISLTTGVSNGSGPVTIFGGSGRFAYAYGTVEGYFNDLILAAPSPYDLFGSVQTSVSGWVTP